MGLVTESIQGRSRVCTCVPRVWGSGSLLPSSSFPLWTFKSISKMSGSWFCNDRKSVFRRASQRNSTFSDRFSTWAFWKSQFSGVSLILFAPRKQEISAKPLWHMTCDQMQRHRQQGALRREKISEGYHSFYILPVTFSRIYQVVGLCAQFYFLEELLHALNGSERNSRCFVASIKTGCITRRHPAGAAPPLHLIQRDFFGQI